MFDVPSGGVSVLTLITRWERSDIDEAGTEGTNDFIRMLTQMMTS